MLIQSHEINSFKVEIYQNDIFGKDVYTVVAGMWSRSYRSLEDALGMFKLLVQERGLWN